MMLYSSAARYLNGPEGMRNEVDMWYAAAMLVLQESVKNLAGGFGGLGERIGNDVRKSLPNISILDVCCGPGNFANYVSLLYPHLEVTGIDTNETFLACARERFGSQGWKFLQEDAAAFDLGRTFDFILAGSAYHHIEDAQKIAFLQRMGRHLSDGRIVMCDNFLPEASARADAVNRYYHALIEWYEQGNATPEAIEVIREVHQLELRGEEEHKVPFSRFTEDAKQSGLEILLDRPIWQPPEFRADNAGSHVLLLARA